MGQAENFVNTAVKKAFCSNDDVRKAPLVVLLSKLNAVQRAPGAPFLFVEGNAKNGGADRSYAEVADVKKAFLDGELHPGDFKAAFQATLKGFLKPLSDSAKKPEIAKPAKEIDAAVKKEGKKK